MLSGYTGLTYSLLLIMLETTESIDIFFPMMVAIMVSRATSKLFTRSLYDRALRTKQIPLLRKEGPRPNRAKPVSEMMVLDVVTLPAVADMESIRRCLATTHQAFPVMNSAGNLIGLMPRRAIAVIFKHQSFYPRERIGQKKESQGDEEVPRNALAVSGAINDDNENDVS